MQKPTVNPDGTIKINVNEIPDAVYDVACRILDTSVRRYFEKPGVKEAYEKWLVEYEKELEEKKKERGVEDEK